MIVRSAILEGSIPAADRQQFDAQMAGPVLAAIGTYPGIRQVKLRRLVQADDGTPRSTWCLICTLTAWTP